MPEPPDNTSNWLDRFLHRLPKLDRDERKALSARVAAGTYGGLDFQVMMALSSGLASLGLLADSTAVVIGAMLVAPLMGPLIGAGLAIAQGNIRLYRNAIAVTVFGLLIGFAVSVFVGLVNPGFEPSLEVEARGSPDVLDLGVAVLSGFVAAYALGRPGVANTLAGVAIAAALVPPLCVVGIGLTNDQMEVSVNASILLLTNLVAIILSAAFGFIVLGMRSAITDSGLGGWTRRAVIVMIMLTVFLLMPLVSNVAERKRLGQAKPLAYPVAAHVHEAVIEYLDKLPGVTLITIARVSVEPTSSVGILLAATDRLPSGVKEDLREIVHEVRGGDPNVRILVLQEVLEQPAGVELQ